jgi:hypothetical protein
MPGLQRRQIGVSMKQGEEKKLKARHNDYRNRNNGV